MTIFVFLSQPFSLNTHHKNYRKRINDSNRLERLDLDIPKVVDQLYFGSSAIE